MSEQKLDVISNDEPEEEAPHSQPSVVDLLRQDYQELLAVEHVFIPVKGYERVGLTVKYRLPESGKELDTIARKVMREQKDNFTRNLNIAMDTMIVLCEGLYVQPTSDEVELHPEEPVELDPELTGSPVRFDERLAKALGFEDVQSARAVVKKLFGGNDIAIIGHAEKLSRWLTDTKSNLDVEFWELGE